MADHSQNCSEFHRKLALHSLKSSETAYQTNFTQVQPQLQINDSRWTPEQQLLFYRFLKINKERLQKQSFAKKYNKFVKMADYIITKTVTQCRSHFQKTLKKHQNIVQFLCYFEKKIKKDQLEKRQKKQIGTQTEDFVNKKEIEKESPIKLTSLNNSLKTALNHNLQAILQLLDN